MATRPFKPKPSPLRLHTFLPRSNKAPMVRLAVTDFNPSVCLQSVATTSVVTPVVAPTKSETCSTYLARMWREIQGSDDWERLVDPLHPLLRKEIIRYGEFVAACYKAFDLDPNSKRYLNCKYGKRNVLREVGMHNCGYQVTKYIYATPDINIPTQNGACCARWIGYIAVASDDEVRRLGRRDIIVTFRGTVTNTEWIANFMSSLTPARLDPHVPRPDVKVESGFLSLYTSDDSTCKFSNGSCREQLLSELSRLINEYKDEEISITVAGHSMGSSLAMLLGYDIAELGLNTDESGQEIPITVFSFGGPRVGNSGFKERCDELGVKVLRIVNVNDPITKLPGVLFNENFRVLGGIYELPWSCSCYAHVGVELALDFFEMQNPSCVHDLETYVSLLRCPKMVQVQRDGIDLVNKAKEFFAAQKLDLWPLQHAARKVGTLVQSLRT
ncbi:galactolipase DONGLE, chloroplastic-like [Aristolochia californica]|uniref:galactolipase DONGLE, chloroplastic-like n=1 Tax=Aristolochia californica TaxID=171875 RepID=UPI0035E05F7B